jgi:hypothetical protein
MASPFPGMDPYLEDPAFWRDFHNRFINFWCEAIADQLPDSYEARLDETVNLVHMEEVIKNIYPDIAVTRSGQAARSKSRTTGTMVLEPISLPHEYLDEERQSRIHILHRPERSLITVLELLSPTHKNGAGFEEYRGKRRGVMQQKIHLVELDLLLAGKRPALSCPLPEGDYFAYTSRVENWPNCDVYSWMLRHALPTIPVPLKAPDEDVHVDLAKVFQTTYKRGRYARSLWYGKKRKAPLSKPDAKWATALSAKK